jgi:NAD(P)H-dependent FMN reductase
LSDLYLPVLLGTVRQGNRSHGVADFVLARGRGRPGVETRLFDPAMLPFGNLVQREWEMDPRPPEVAAFVTEMARADGFLIVTPEYNRGLPGALKNLLDHLYEPWNRKPFALVGVSNGPVGGARVVMALHDVVMGLGGVTVPLAILVREVDEVFEGDHPVKDAEKTQKGVDKLWGELEWYARALKAARSAPAR